MARCMICHTLIEGAEESTECPSCRQSYHASCWEDLGGCATFGCEEAVAGEKPPPPTLVGAGWGDLKTCPQCGTEIGASLLVCTCGARFPYADPMTPEQYAGWRAEGAELRKARLTIGVLFVVALTGIPAPFAGVAAGLYAHSKRTRLLGADGTYLALGYGTAALGATYALIELLLLLGL